VKLALRVISTSVVAAGAALTAYLAQPVLASAEPMAVPAPALAMGSITTRSSAAPSPKPARPAAPVPVMAADPEPLEGAENTDSGGEVEPSADTDDTGLLAELPIPMDPALAPAWHRPAWFPPVLDVDAVGQMYGEAIGGRGPSLRSRSAFVYDLDAGQVLIDKNADVVRPVASLTKMVSSLALMSLDPDLDTQLCVGAAQYPTRSGARSRLSTGDCVGGWDVLGAALVASDNRAAYALAAVSGLDMDDFVARMNEVSADLGMDHSSWSDPSGLEDENLSTARDIARATVAVAAHPVLAPVSTAPWWDLYREGREEPRRLYTTDRLSGRTDIEVLAAKTGYTDTARYCFSTVVETRDGRRLVITLLGAEGKMTRWADVDRVLRWVESGAA
jgi:D-alanyl-D-alanine endopeptidase (penicillin-binding protein 7)